MTHKLPEQLPDIYYSLTAEQELLAAVLSNPACLDDVADVLEYADFYNVQNRRIYEQIVAICETADGPIDAVALGTSMDHDDMVYALEMHANATGYSNVRSYARIISDRAKLRRLRAALQDSIDNLAEVGGNSAEAIEYAQAKLIGLESKQFNAEIQDANTVLKRVIQALDERTRKRGSGELDGLSTGFADLDERFNGLRPGHFIVLAARPSMGKSAFAMQIAQHVAITERKGVLVFSLEMPTDELFERMISAQGRLSYTKIRSGDLSDEDWPKLSAGVSKLKDSPIKIVDTPGMNINQIRAYSRKAHRQNPVSLVIVDHINIAKGDAKNGREREVASISYGLKSLAKELNCPVIGLCQLNRDCEKRTDKRPIMADLRESGAIEQDADIVAFMYRDDYYNEDSRLKGTVEIITRKFRGGETGKDVLANRLDIMRMEDLAPGNKDQFYQAQEKAPGFSL